MKHFFKVFAPLLLSVSFVEALPQGNPVMPNAMEEGIFFCKDNFFALKAGYLGDTTRDIRFKTENIKEIEAPPAPNLFKSRHSRGESRMHLGTVAVNIFNQVEPYGFVGSMEGEYIHTPRFDRVRRKYKTDWDTAFGGGLRLLGFYWKSATLGFDGKYLYANLPIRRVVVGGRTFGSNGTWAVRQWQVAAALAISYKSIAPYLGVRYISFNDKIRHVKQAAVPFESFKMKSRCRYGGTVGLGWIPGDYFAVNVEYRFYDEEGFSASLDIKF